MAQANTPPLLLQWYISPWTAHICPGLWTLSVTECQKHLEWKPCVRVSTKKLCCSFSFCVTYKQACSTLGVHGATPPPYFAPPTAEGCGREVAAFFLHMSTRQLRNGEWRGMAVHHLFWYPPGSWGLGERGRHATFPHPPASWGVGSRGRGLPPFPPAWIKEYCGFILTYTNMKSDIVIVR